MSQSMAENSATWNEATVGITEQRQTVRRIPRDSGLHRLFEVSG